MVVPAAFRASIYRYIIFRVAEMPAGYQFGVEYLLSRLRTKFNYKVPSVSISPEYEMWLRVPFV
jgi:hypothetical protein